MVGNTMKYMGSKRSMLKNGLGDLLIEEAARHRRFFDLFSGSGVVASFVAARIAIPVHAFDLQQYGRVLAGSIIERTSEVDFARTWKNWYARAARWRSNALIKLPDFPVNIACSPREIDEARKWCLRSRLDLTSAYGGHYFSPEQSIWLDALRATISLEKKVELAALLDAVSECAAAPGHTAQPFQPTPTARRFIATAWGKSVSGKTRDALRRICVTSAQVAGTAAVGDANQAAQLVERGDLVFLDPPYSALQYSRFYHVFESVVHGCPGYVEGVGRYPRPELRPKSSYSMKSLAFESMRNLLGVLAERGATVILTFPDHKCSNGLSGELISKIARELFSVSRRIVKSRLSTLGGTGMDCIETERRGARRDAHELILLLRPRG